MSIEKSRFGNDFVWGCATAAYQIEGAISEGGKTPSIWDTFTHKDLGQGRTPIKDGTDGDQATDSYHRYPEDLDILKSMGFDAYRFSLSWPRILPNGTGQVNQAGLDHYKRLIDTCLEKGIDPWVTVYHWDLPQVLEDKGGWTNRDILGWFTEYATVVADALGDRVKHWMVFNEPMSFTVLGHLLGQHAPGRKGPMNFFSAVHHVNMCTALGYRAMKASMPTADIGTTQYLTPALGSGIGPLAGIAERSANAIFNRMYLEPNLGLGYPWLDNQAINLIRPYIKGDDMDQIVVDLDFMGVQYYTRIRAPFLPIPGMWTFPQFGKDPSVGLTSLGWEIRPEGLGMVIDMVHKYGKYKRLVVTEGGASFNDVLADGRVHDPQRISYYESHLEQVAAARERGIDVTGYFAWSLLDNFEWAEGKAARFGLAHVDYATQQRTIKDAGYWFAQLLGGDATPPE